ENPFYSSKSYQSFGKTWRLYPFQSPICFFLDGREVFNGIKQLVFFSFIFYICINQQGVCFTMNVFHHDLKPVKKLSLTVLHFVYKVFGQVFVNYPITCCKKS